LARQELHGAVFEGRNLAIHYYEIKEVRQVQMEEAVDKADFEKYKAQEIGQDIKWTDLQATPNLVSIISQLIGLLVPHEERRNYRHYPRRDGRRDKRQTGG